jgi:hypothetical protein
LGLSAVHRGLGCFHLCLDRHLSGLGGVKGSFSRIEIRLGGIHLLFGNRFQILLKKAVVTVVIDLCDIVGRLGLQYLRRGLVDLRLALLQIGVRLGYSGLCLTNLRDGLL